MMSARMIGLLAIGGVLCFGTRAEACLGCSANQMQVLPGFWLLGPLNLGAVFLLMSFLERPFYTWAGVKHNALANSMVGTALGMLVISFLAFFWMVLGIGGSSVDLLWGLVAAAIAAAVKRAFLNRRRSPWRSACSYDFLFYGTLLSYGVVFLLPLLQAAFGFDARSHARAVEPLKALTGFLAFTAGVVALILAACRVSAEAMEVGAPPASGFEVMIPTPPLTTMMTPMNENSPPQTPIAPR